MRLAVDYSLNSTDPTDPTDPTDGPIPVLSPTETPVWIEVGGEVDHPISPHNPPISTL